MVALLYASIVVSAPLCSLCPGDGEGAIVQDGLVVVLKYKLLSVLLLHICAVDFLAGIFALPECANVKVVIQNPLYCGDAPSRFYFPMIFFPG